MQTRRNVLTALSASALAPGATWCSSSPEGVARSVTEFGDVTGARAGATLARALDWVRTNGGGTIVLPSRTDILLDVELRLPSGLQLIGDGSCTIHQTRPGLRALVADDVHRLLLQGFTLTGSGPRNIFDPERRQDNDGEAPRVVSEAALVHIRSSTSGASSDITFRNVSLREAFNLLAVRGASNVLIEDCSFEEWLLYGVLASGTSRMRATRNHFRGCVQNEGYTAYAFSATGDGARGFPQSDLRFDNNVIVGVPSWDGFMTHEVNGLVVENNQFRDVRNGVDITSPTGPIANVRVSGNRIEHTRHDTWRGRSAAHFSIAVAADPSAPTVENAVVENNVSIGANSVPGLSSGGYAIGAMIFSKIRNLTVKRNTISDIGDEDAQLKTPKGFDVINVYMPTTTISIQDNKADGSLSRYFLEFHQPETFSARDISIISNSFHTSSPVHEFMRFLGGQYDSVSHRNNMLASASPKVTEVLVGEKTVVWKRP